MSETWLSALPPLRQVLQEQGLTPKKNLGQNFLLDLNVTHKIARFAGELREQEVLEIGPGPGGLTRAILNQAPAGLTVVEKDTRCLAILDDLARQSPKPLRILNQDALALDLHDLTPSPNHIIANLPYNVATPLLIGWLKAIAPTNRSDVKPSPLEGLKSMVLMFQKEVGQRICAAPGSKAFGRLAIMCQWLCHVEPLYELPPSAFTPPPKVTSLVVGLRPRSQPLFPASFEQVEKLAQVLFAHRRKMLRQTLKSWVPEPSTWLESRHIDPTRRAETLDLQEFAKLIQGLYSS